MGLGKFDEIGETAHSAQHIMETNFGVTHPYCATWLENLAEFYEELENPPKPKCSGIAPEVLKAGRAVGGGE